MPTRDEGLSPAEKAFCHEYIKCGSKTEAYIKAFKPDTEKVERVTISGIAYSVSKRPRVQEYIAELSKIADDEAIADIKEVMKFYSSVMRGEVKDQFGLDASLQDRVAAGKELAKRFDAGVDKNKEALEKLDEVLQSITSSM